MTGAGPARRWLTGLLWTNLALALTLLVLAQVGALAPPQAWRVGGTAFLYANLTALPCILFLPPVLERRAGGGAPTLHMVLAGMTVFTLAGTLLAQGACSLLGLMPWDGFWRGWLRVQAVALPVGLVLGPLAVFQEGLRQRVREAERKAAERALAEERARKLAAEARLQALEARLHPHFLFNTLNSVSALIATDPARSEQLLERLVALLRTALDKTRRPLIPLGEELGLLEAYVEIERARLGVRLESQVDVPEPLRQVLVPPLSVQSLVENAVKHGISPLRQGGDFRVTARQEGAALLLEVSDSGPGFELAGVPAGHGLDNLAGRLEALFGHEAGLTVGRVGGRCVVGMRLPRAPGLTAARAAP